MTDAPQKTTWDDLKALLRWVVVLFGEPKAMAQAQIFYRKEGLLLRGWLCALEAMARALLVMAAAEIPDPQPLASRAGGRRGPRIAPLTEYITFGDIADSETWADVRFRVFPSESAASAARGRKKPPARCFYAKPLAWRLEALIRLIEDPSRAALRVARRLAAEPALAWRLLRESSPPACPSFPHRDVGRARGFAWAAHDAAFAPDTG